MVIDPKIFLLGPLNMPLTFIKLFYIVKFFKHVTFLKVFTDFPKIFFKGSFNAVKKMAKTIKIKNFSFFHFLENCFSLIDISIRFNWMRHVTYHTKLEFIREVHPYSSHAIIKVYPIKKLCSWEREVRAEKGEIIHVTWVNWEKYFTKMVWKCNKISDIELSERFWQV